MSTRNWSGRNTDITNLLLSRCQNRRSLRCAVISTAVLAGAACFLAEGARGASTDIWTGLSGVNTNWGTGGNWITTNASGIPATDDLLSFNGSTNLASTDNISGLVIDGLGFGSGAGAYVLSGSTPLTLDTAYGTNAAVPTFTGGYISNSNGVGATTETVNAPISFTGGNHTLTTTAGSGALVFGGAMTISAGTSVQFNTAGGAINLSGTGLANINGILSGWATIGNSLATLNGSGNVVAYTGATAAPGSFTANANLTNYNITTSGGTMLITPASGDSYVDINSITYSPPAAQTETIESATAGIPIRLGAQGVIMNTNGAAGSMTFGGGSTYSLTAGGSNNTNGNLYLVDLTTAGVGNTGGNVGINEKIVDNGTGRVSVTTLGSVNFGSAIANTYSGGTYINSGDAYVNNGVLGTGPVYVYGGGRVDYGGNNSATIANNFYIEGYGYVSGSTNQPGSIKASYKGTITGNITLLGNSSIDPNSGTAYAIVSGTIGGNGSFTVGGVNSGYVGGALTLGGTLSYTGDTIIDNTTNKAAMGINISSGANSTGQSLTKAGNGTLLLSGLSNFSGGTTVNAGTLNLAGNSLGVGTIIGTLNINASGTVVASVQNAFGYSTGTSVTNVNINGGLLNSTAAGDQGWGIAYNLSGGTMETNGGVSSNNTAVGDFSFGGHAGPVALNQLWQQQWRANWVPPTHLPTIPN